MYFKKIFTESIAHYSYIVGDGNQLIVIDPQPEINVYLDISRKKSMKITKILETHRNEDFLVGSKALSDVTGAKIYISGHEDLDYKYGEKIYGGHEFNIGDIRIDVLHTPGHTLGHLSYVLYFKENIYMVFVGDTCFYGDIGRTDFYGEDKVEAMTGMIYDSIFNLLMPLGDHVIMCPAHGSGSACGENTEERPCTTLGYEKKYNPKLQYRTKEKFIKNNSKIMYKPKYFEYMETMNLIGASPIDCNPYIKIKYAEDINLKNECILDIRDQNAFNKIHIPNSIYVNKGEISNFINYIIDRASNICIVSDSSCNLDNVYIDLRRIGYTGDISYLSGGIRSWIESKEATENLETVLPKEFRKVKDDYFILDVRKKSEVNEDKEYENGMIIPMEEISERYLELKDRANILVICPSGIRSNIAGSFIKSKGIDCKILMGGINAVE